MIEVPAVDDLSFDKDADQVLLCAAKDEGSRLLESLVTLYSKRLFHLVLRITKNREDAEDVVQETCLRVQRHLDTYRAEASLSTWLTRIAINQALMCIRKRRSSILSLDENSASDSLPLVEKLSCRTPTPEEALTSLEHSEHILHAAHRLPEALRLVFILRDVHELSTTETALALQISSAAAKSRLLRARKRVRQYISSLSARRSAVISPHPSPPSACFGETALR